MGYHNISPDFQQENHVFLISHCLYPFWCSEVLLKGKSGKLQRPLYCYCLALFNITADCKKRIGVRCLPPTSRHQGFFGLDFTKIMTYLFGDCPVSFNFFDNTTFVDLLLGEILTIIIVKNLQAPSYVLIYFYLRIVLFSRL